MLSEQEQIEFDKVLLNFFKTQMYFLEAISVYGGLQLGILLSMTHPEWAQAYAQNESRFSHWKASVEVVEGIIESCPMNYVIEQEL